MGKKSTAACSVVRIVHDMRQLEQRCNPTPLPKIAVFDWLAQALELARTDG
jgi:hypothetical protein